MCLFTIGPTFFLTGQRKNMKYLYLELEQSGHLSVRACRGRSGPASWCPRKITGPLPHGKSLGTGCWWHWH